MKITPSDSVYQSPNVEVKLLSAKIWNFVFFARRKITDARLFVFFSRGNRIDPVVLKYRERAHSEGK